MGTGQERHQTRVCLFAGRHNSSTWIQKVTMITCNKVSPPEAALSEADFPHGLEKKSGTTSYSFLYARPGIETYPATLRTLKEPNIPFSYGSAGPAKSTSPQLRRLAAS
ncbi:hypothetical protein CHARACLAT_019847 [Characodon lateralis]|uniref:Uncharacterized protein n=1 Tax=Characodon lateralis TaxID=208331 RepID=A0ABU7DJY1_9TELE|nr:hypothetical protein [Characodon lateralis]